MRIHHFITNSGENYEVLLRICSLHNIQTKFVVLRPVRAEKGSEMAELLPKAEAFFF